MNPRYRSRQRVAAVLGGSTALVLLAAAAANAVITPSQVSNDLGTAMSATPVTGSSLKYTYSCSTACPTAVSSTPLAGFPTNGPTYTILTTGDAALADDPNTAGNSGKDWLQDPSADLGTDTHDAQVLRVDVGPATSSCLAFDFRFLSEEYPEFVNAGYNDAFVAQLDTFSVHVDPTTQTVSAPGNFAAGAGDIISVDGSGPSAMFDTAAAGMGTTYDGATPLLIARKPVTPGSSHQLYLTIFDQGDGILDSAVFLDNLRFENLPANQCKSLALDPYEGQTGVAVTPGKAPTLGSKLSSVSVPLDCTLPPGSFSCTVNGVTTFVPSKARVQARGSDSKAGAVTFATGSVTIPGAQSGTLVMSTSKAGKKAVAKAAKAPAKLMKKARKLLRQAHATKDPVKAAKLVKKAKKLIKKAKKLKKKPLGSLVISVKNPANNATQTIATMTLKR